MLNKGAIPPTPEQLRGQPLGEFTKAWAVSYRFRGSIDSFPLEQWQTWHIAWQRFLECPLSQKGQAASD